MKCACPKCLSLLCVKAGFKTGKQRYKCKKCGCFYTQSQSRGFSVEVKKQAIQLYLEGLGFRAIGRVLKVSHVTVQNWVNLLGEAIQKVKSRYPARVQRIELDEIHHYVGEKKTLAGFGLQLMVSETDGSTLLWVGVIQPQVKTFGTR
jgi:transposase